MDETSLCFILSLRGASRFLCDGFRAYYRHAKLRSPCGPFVSCGGCSRGGAARRAEVW